MKQYQYHPMHMHIHSCFQPGASMAQQMYNAQKLGMQYIWITDHDSRMGTKKMPVTGFSFDTESLIKEEGEKDFYGFEISSFDNLANMEYAINTETKTLTVQASAADCDKWQSAGMHFVSSRTRHTGSLLNEFCLKMGLAVEEIGENARLILDVRLSQRPPECERAHMLYVLGNSAGLESRHTQILPLTIQNGICVLPISKEVSEEENIGGKDNAFDTLTITLQVRKKAQMKVHIKDFQIETKKDFEEIHALQMEEAARVGQRYGVTPFVSFEISSAGEHKNCFSTHVPVLNYRALGFCVSHEDAVAHVKKHGGMFCINHPLAINPLKRKSFTEAERMRVIAKMAAELLATHADGAKLMEVGFPMGRNGFSIGEYAYLWDLLSLGGVFLCGYGSSDSHRDNAGWFDGNNFAAYVAAEEELPYPVPETVFTDSMRRGNVYTGDPCKLKGKISFMTEDGHPMGTVFPEDMYPEISIVFAAENVSDGWVFRLIENGNEIYTETLSAGDFCYRSSLKRGIDPVRFQRAELYDETGRCILLTNPIYMARNSAELAIPKERLPKEGNE